MKNNQIKQKKDKNFSRSLLKFSKISICVLISILFPYPIWAQFNYKVNSKASLGEKVYLQLDAKVYTTGNIIWFKCIVANAVKHVPSSLSKVLYVELIKPDETIYEKKLIKLENGIGEGFFNVDKYLHQGTYLIRAYTHWNKNFETDFLFEEYIQVFTSDETEKTPINKVTLMKNKTDENYIEASFNPLEIDSLHKNDLTVFITLDNTKDTLRIKSGKDKMYRLSYPIAHNSQLVTLQIQTENRKRFTKTIALNDKYIDLQFFPESGELLHGLQSKIGFKAIDANGQGKVVQGDIVDENDAVITHFKSNALGMGSFVLDMADSTKTYFARMTSQTADNQFLSYPLPAVASVGNKLSVIKQGENIIVGVQSNYLVNDSIGVRFSYRGLSFYENKVGLNDGALEFVLPSNQLPEGIISFAMLNQQMLPIAERLYFNERPETRLHISLLAHKKIYSEREQTKLSVKTTDSVGTPIKANLSLLVINKKQLGKMQSIRQNILSWFLLDSELTGEIENPGFYFSNNSSKFDDLDALMLTQGWRKYHYSKPYNNLQYKPESSLAISGRVSGILSTKKGKEAELTLITFGKSKNLYRQETDSQGKFYFNLDDEYGKQLNILIQSSKKAGRNVDYTISLDRKESPPVDFNPIKTHAKIDSVVQFLVVKNEERERIDKAFPLDSGYILINEVEVKAYNLTPNRKKVIEAYGEPDEVIDGVEIQDKKEKWHDNLYRLLLFNFGDKIRIDSDEEGNLSAKVYGSESTLIIVDGIPVKSREYYLLQRILPSQVSSVEIIKCAPNFARLNAEVEGFSEETLDTEDTEITVAPPSPILCGSIIAIYTYGGKGIYFLDEPTGIVTTAVPIFSEPREFYAPKYENPQADNWHKPDLRALIHWVPVIKTDSLGNATASFYNADNGGKMMVVVEAISENGNIGYKEIDYEIEGKEKEFIVVE